jgi:hypothetical protein
MSQTRQRGPTDSRWRVATIAPRQDRPAISAAEESRVACCEPPVARVLGILIDEAAISDSPPTELKQPSRCYRDVARNQPFVGKHLTCFGGASILADNRSPVQ